MALTVSQPHTTDRNQVYVQVCDGAERVAFLYGATADEARDRAAMFVAIIDHQDVVDSVTNDLHDLWERIGIDHPLASDIFAAYFRLMHGDMLVEG